MFFQEIRDLKLAVNQLKTDLVPSLQTEISALQSNIAILGDLETSEELFMGILQKDGVLSMEIMKLLSDDLRKAETSITHLAQKPVRERLAEALLFIKETYGFEEDNMTINLKLSREELANLVGTATETVIRLLSEFKSDNMIALEGKKIKIIDLDELVQTANIDD
jgi:CRP/FNR family transcriptional regulator, polysaccharide utilization system transcription regulator